MNDISPQILPVVEGFLPSLILLIFISITKPIIKLLYSHQGESSHSNIEWRTMATYWAFLIFNVFLVSTLGGAFLKVRLFLFYFFDFKYVNIFIIFKIVKLTIKSSDIEQLHR